jgi:outer membrane immunogenic protein
MSPLLAQSGHPGRATQCPLLGVKRTSAEHGGMSAFDPKRTFEARMPSRVGTRFSRTRSYWLCALAQEFLSGVCHASQPSGGRTLDSGYFRGAAMKKIALSIVAGLIATPAFAADMAVKAPPAAPAPVPTWTGFYGGVQFGGGWSDEAVNYSPNDPAAAGLLSGGLFAQQPPANGYRIPQSGLVGGFEAGYNWQAGSNWLLGLETDFSFSGMDGRASGTSIFVVAGSTTQTTTAQQSTDWYGTVRGRAGWLATPNLLLFGAGGFAYGRVAASANYMTNPLNGGGFTVGGGNFSFSCTNGVTCFAGSSSAMRTGWTAGGGGEWLLDQHWSAKIEYQFVDLGTETVRITAFAVGVPGNAPASFNAAFHDRFNVVRLGLNYHF